MKKKQSLLKRFIFILSWVSLFMLLSLPAFGAGKQVKLLTLEWEPYVGANMLGKGFTAEIVRQALVKAGYSVVIEFHAWDKAMAIAARGDADGVFPAYKEKSREMNFIFSNPFAESPLGLCRRKYFRTQSPTGISEKTGVNIQFTTDPRIDETQALKELSKYSFGIVKGYANTPVFDAANFLTKKVAKSDTDNIAWLLRGQVDLIVIDRYVARNIMVKKYPWHSDKVEFMYPPLSVKKLYLAVSKKSGNPEKLVRDFNAGLRILKEDGIVDQLKHQYGF